ncbi:hypothetical protein HKBW3S43_01045 [Candidatus Hakubella thermalkaliphila]|uniref:Uncharacterized protein n=1 Tax=Candidatus Hakubella thermalkaliphila TaxID=2754717 RepID=A0A6V8P307_9ACTN|nr:hypothetical protein [Candidatus Hakubella thermalkaliphila]MBT9167207.1 hypothetical protein [Bacillota bacterium]MBT9174063.1 hypothetical protein [Bacillota bacterium]GFP24783.1 hypothetical protein HKBW3S25_00220 [Candidatus Hakubella thermalkaliphila]GFP26949.1 hypothetical protein HKBW3S33_00362 [Candidatus Hakubella thermalkaliphila]GFP35253.1 hypothetical protein HKBW3S43_01045 [Candidatus Hakubella thermalkaliphila]
MKLSGEKGEMVGQKKETQEFMAKLSEVEPEYWPVLEAMVETLPKAIKVKGKLKKELLEHYATREPQAFFQFDGFADVEEDCVMKPDKDGDCLFSRVTHELMTGTYRVRVLITPGTSKEKALALLQKISGWIKRGGLEYFYTTESQDDGEASLF